MIGHYKKLAHACLCYSVECESRKRMEQMYLSFRLGKTLVIRRRSDMEAVPSSKAASATEPADSPDLHTELQAIAMPRTSANQ